MKRLRECWEAHFLLAEFALAVALSAGFAAWARFLGGDVQLEELLAGNRSEVYGTLASVFGALLGFTITAVSIVLGYAQSDRLTVVRESKHYPKLWAVFTAANKALALATLVALVGLVVDRDSTPAPVILYVMVFAVLLSSFRLLRCIWVLENVVKIITAPSKTRQGGG